MRRICAILALALFIGAPLAQANDDDPPPPKEPIPGPYEDGNGGIKSVHSVPYGDLLD